MEPGGHSMLDPLHVGVMTLSEKFHENDGFIKSLDSALRAAEDAVQNTKTKNRKYPDPGAHAVGIWLRAVYEGIKLRCD